MNAIAIGNNTVTMTSLEMVEYINSQRGPDEAELRHRDFCAKVSKVLGEGVCEKFRVPHLTAKPITSSAFRSAKPA